MLLSDFLKYLWPHIRSFLFRDVPIKESLREHGIKWFLLLSNLILFLIATLSIEQATLQSYEVRRLLDTNKVLIVQLSDFQSLGIKDYEDIANLGQRLFVLEKEVIYYKELIGNSSHKPQQTLPTKSTDNPKPKPKQPKKKEPALPPSKGPTETKKRNLNQLLDSLDEL